METPTFDLKWSGKMVISRPTILKAKIITRNFGPTKDFFLLFIKIIFRKKKNRKYSSWWKLILLTWLFFCLEAKKSMTNSSNTCLFFFLSVSVHQSVSIKLTLPVHRMTLDSLWVPWPSIVEFDFYRRKSFHGYHFFGDSRLLELQSSYDLFLLLDWLNDMKEKK